MQSSVLEINFINGSGILATSVIVKAYNTVSMKVKNQTYPDLHTGCSTSVKRFSFGTAVIIAATVLS